ncbi:MAG: gliding motility-associated C-terminal domain-containing protein [Crocinitomicaceae bacterium]
MNFKPLLLILISLQFALAGYSQENCFNGIDDDNDGLIDLNDPDCACSGVTTTPTSIIPNPSFETINCCPSYFSELNCADTWVQASDATSDLFNTCDYIGVTPAAGLFPFPDGNGAAAFLGLIDYKEYLGACLTNPMVAGTPYTLQFSLGYMGLQVDQTTFDIVNCTPLVTPTTMDIVLYGNPNCGNLPYFGMDCPTATLPSYSIIGSSTFSLTATGYQLITINFTPTFNVNEIILGFPCNMPIGWPSNLGAATGECMPYVVVDNLIMNSSSSFGGLSITTQGTLCGNDVVLTANVGSVGTFQWYNAGVAISGQTNSTLNVSVLGLGSGTYNVRFDDGTNCFIDSVTINSQAGGSVTSNDAQICAGESATLTASGAVSYTWSPIVGLNSSTVGTVIASPMVTTTYTVVGTDANGCSATSTSLVTVIQSPNDASVAITPTEIETEATITLSPSTYTYTWISPDLITSTGNSLFYEFSGEGLYEFTVVAENSFGCTYEFLVPITVNSNLLVYVPNAFTPDHNEFNDRFSPVLSGSVDENSYVFTVLNRWGEIVFQTHDMSIGWDGTFNQKKVETGMYNWTLELKMKNYDERHRFNGHVNVL